MKKCIILAAAVCFIAVTSRADDVRRPQDFRADVRLHADTSVEGSGSLDIESGGAFKIAGTEVTSSAAELNKLDGFIGTTEQLNNAAAGTPAGDLAVNGNITAGTNITATAGDISANGNVTAGTNVVVGADIELGHASDTTLSRTGAGDIAIEGNAVYRAGGTDVPDGDVADTITLNGGSLGTTTSVSGNGTVNSTYASVTESGGDLYHKTVITITNAFDVTLADGDHGGGQSLYDFPEGIINIHGVVLDANPTNTANFNASDDDHYYFAVGTVVAADDNDLTGTEADLIAKIDQDTAAGGTTTQSEETFLAADAIIDGSTTALKVAANFAIEATDNSDANTFGLTVNDTITVIWSKLGDY